MVVLGKIIEPYGVRGWVKIRPFADDPAAWAAMPVWWLGREEMQDWREMRLQACRLHGDTLVCQFEGISDRSPAEALKGLLVAAPREALPATATDEYYWADLIGLEVVNVSGQALGRVEGLLATGASDVLRVVTEDGVERLLPFVAQVVLVVEKDAGCIRVDWEADW